MGTSNVRASRCGASILTGDELTAYQQDPKTQPSIQMMGQGTGQRSTLTVNHGSYYIDTTKNTGGKTASNDFMSGHSYYVYLLYAKPSTHQNYSIYIGKQLAQPDALASVTPGLVDVTTQAYKFIASSGGDWVMNKAYDAASGVLSLTVDLKNQGPVFEGDRPKFCQPTTYCSIHSDGSCGCKAGSGCNDDSVCAWSNKEIDCPIEGCFGFSVKLPANFPAAGQNLPTPQPACLPAILTSPSETSSSITSTNRSPAHSATTTSRRCNNSKLSMRPLPLDR